MGATSVTGKGVGAAFDNKGPKNGRDQFVSLLGPRVVAAGSATMDGAGTATVGLGELPFGFSELMVVAQNITTGAAVTGLDPAACFTVNATGHVVAVTLTSAAAEVVNYMVVVVGL